MVAEIGELDAAAGGGSITIGGTTLRGGFASEAFRGRGLVSFDWVDDFDKAGEGISLGGAGLLGGASADGGASLDISFGGFPLGFGLLSSGRAFGPAALLPPRPPPRPPRPPPLPGLPRLMPRKAEPDSPFRPHPCLLGGWLAHIDELTPPDGVDEDAADAMRMRL